MKRIETAMFSKRLERRLYEDELEKEYSIIFSNELQKWSEIKFMYTNLDCQEEYAEYIEEDIKDYGLHYLALERGCPIIYLKWILKNKERILEKAEKEREKRKKWWQFWRA